LNILWGEETHLPRTDNKEILPAR